MAEGILVGGVGVIRKSSDYGATWSTPYSGALTINSMCWAGNGVVYAQAGSNILKSINYGDFWSDLGVKTIGSSIKYLGNNSLITIASGGTTVYKSIDGGVNWTSVDLTIILNISGYSNLIYSCSEGFVDGEAFLSAMTFGGFVSASSAYIFRTTNYGGTWTQQTGAPGYGTGAMTHLKKTGDGYLHGIFPVKPDGMLNYRYLYRSVYKNSTQTWTTSSVTGVAITVGPMACGAGINKAVEAHFGSPVKYSRASTPYTSWTDYSSNWYSEYEHVGSYLFGIRTTGAIERSANDGDSWTEVYASGTTHNSLLRIPPTADFTGTPVSGDANLSVQFTDTSVGAINWLWDFGDGGTSTLQNPLHTYTVAGSYTVVLYIS